MASSMQLASLLSNMRMPEGVNPVTINLPPPPKLEGALQPNNVLARAVKFAENMVTGPESMVLSNGYVYTGLADGNVVEVKPSGTVRKIRRMSVNGCGRPNAGEGACGRPLGVREHRGWLIVADAYQGIIALSPTDGRFQILVDGRLRVNGKRIGGFINDLAVAKDGSIYFTSSSSKYTREDYLKVILEGETSGRVLVYNPRFPGRLKVKELVTTLNFPNGLQLSKDEKYLLIAEGARSRIHKAYIDRKSPKYGQIEIFAENLPGFVDNIRLSPRGTLWVGLSRVRHAGLPSVLDQYGNTPRIRAALTGIPRDVVLQQAPKYGMVLEMDLKGQILRSLHDPTGEKYVAVSEVDEENGTLYIGSVDKKFIGKLKLSDLPPIYRPDGGGAGEVNQQLAAFLNQIRERMMTMGLTQVRDIVIALVQNLVQVKLDALRAQSRANALQLEVERLQAIINSQVTTAGPPTEPPPTTTPSSTDQVSTTPAGGQATTTAGGDQGTTSGGGDAGTTSGTTSSGDSAGTTQAPTTTASGDTTAAGTTSASGADDTTAGATTAAGTTAEGTTASGTTAAGTTAGGSTESGTTAAGTTAAGTTAADTTAADSGSTSSPPP